MVKVILPSEGTFGDSHALLSWHYEGYTLDASLEGQKGRRFRFHDHMEGRENNLMMLATVATNKRHLRSAINE